MDHSLATSTDFFCNSYEVMGYLIYTKRQSVVE